MYGLSYSCCPVQLTGGKAIVCCSKTLSAGESTEASQFDRFMSLKSRVTISLAKKAEGANDDTLWTPKPPTMSDRPTSLSPLDIGEIGIGDGEDKISQQFVKLPECRISL